MRIITRISDSGPFRSASRRVSGPVVAFALLLVSVWALPAFARTGAHWGIGWANDEFVGSDNQFTNGILVERHSPVAGSWDAVARTPAFGRTLARRILPARGDRVYRESWIVGHNFQTPDELSVREVILDDAPYVSMFGWANSHIAFNDRRMTGIQTLVGWAGSLTLGEQIQRTVHEITNASDPKGWDNQLDNEPLFNVYAMQKFKFWRNDWFDASFNVDAALGNFFSHAQASVELRFGARRPGGFVLLPTPVGRGMDYDARLPAAGTRVYGSMVVRGTALLFALPRDGNLLRRSNEWTDNNILDPNRLLGQLILGAHVERDHWAVHFNLFLVTDSFDEGPEVVLRDPSNNFGMITFEWTFR